ncbi:MAG: hypothetical protein GPOALKHO_000510 [Sodalis sp.]|nr:MAG: hypothetical protein GPOALKHO_000510 [Sodalis sp.]
MKTTVLVASVASISDSNLKHSWSLAGQAGLDYNISDNCLINMPVWYLDIDTDVRFKARGKKQSIHTDINPVRLCVA